MKNVPVIAQQVILKNEEVQNNYILKQFLIIVKFCLTITEKMLPIKKKKTIEYIVHNFLQGVRLLDSNT